MKEMWGREKIENKRRAERKLARELQSGEEKPGGGTEDVGTLRPRTLGRWVVLAVECVKS
jgi:hypothetical protein